MTRDDFKLFRSLCRAGNCARYLTHNGAQYSVGKFGAVKLDSSGYITPPRRAYIASVIDMMSHARIMGLRQSHKPLIALIRCAV